MKVYSMKAVEDKSYVHQPSQFVSVAWLHILFMVCAKRLIGTRPDLCAGVQQGMKHRTRRACNSAIVTNGTDDTAAHAADKC